SLKNASATDSEEFYCLHCRAASRETFQSVCRSILSIGSRRRAFIVKNSSSFAVAAASLRRISNIRARIEAKSSATRIRVMRYLPSFFVCGFYLPFKRQPFKTAIGGPRGLWRASNRASQGDPFGAADGRP